MKSRARKPKPSGKKRNESNRIEAQINIRLTWSIFNLFSWLYLALSGENSVRIREDKRKRIMFFHIVLERNMQLHPRHFGRNLRENLVSKLMKDVEGTCRFFFSFLSFTISKGLWQKIMFLLVLGVFFLKKIKINWAYLIFLRRFYSLKRQKM